ncbi:hypothetical protein ACU4GH_38625 [Bradyrhizobium betae]
MFEINGFDTAGVSSVLKRPSLAAALKKAKELVEDGCWDVAGRRSQQAGSTPRSKSRPPSSERSPAVIRLGRHCDEALFSQRCVASSLQPGTAKRAGGGLRSWAAGAPFHGAPRG